MRYIVGAIILSVSSVVSYAGPGDIEENVAACKRSYLRCYEQVNERRDKCFDRCSDEDGNCHDKCSDAETKGSERCSEYYDEQECIEKAHKDLEEWRETFPDNSGQIERFGKSGGSAWDDFNKAVKKFTGQ